MSEARRTRTARVLTFAVVVTGGLFGATGFGQSGAIWAHSGGAKNLCDPFGVGPALGPCSGGDAPGFPVLPLQGNETIPAGQGGDKCGIGGGLCC